MQSTTYNSIRSSAYEDNEVVAGKTVFDCAVSSTTIGKRSEQEAIDDSEFETELRELSVCQLQSYLLDSYDSVDLCRQEIEMLQHMDQLARDQEEREVLSKGAQYRAGGASTSAFTDMSKQSDDRMAQIERFGRALPDAHFDAEPLEESAGLEYTTIGKDALGKLIMKWDSALCIIAGCVNE